MQETGEVRIGKQFLSWYRFAHALFQQFLYNDMSAGERRLLHGDVAGVLEMLYAGHTDEIAAELARHHEEAGEDEKAIAYLIQAGDGAFRVYAHNEAIAYTSRALDLGRSGVATHEQLQHLYTQRGRRTSCRIATIRRWRTMKRCRRWGNAPRPALEQEALMLRALAYAVGSGVRDFSKAQALSLDALVLADDLGDRPAEAKVYWILLLTNRFGNEGPRKAIEYGERSLALAGELGPKQQLAFTLKDLAVAYVVVGRFPEARAILPEAISLWRELDNKPMLAEILGGQAAQHFSSGELNQAIRAGGESYALIRASVTVSDSQSQRASSVWRMKNWAKWTWRFSGRKKQSASEQN